MGDIGIGGVFNLAGAAFDAGFSNVKNALKVAFDFVKFDIFSTFFQQIGLWFTRMNFPAKFDEAFHKIMDLVSGILAFISGIPQIYLLYAWGSIATVFFTTWLIQKRYDPEEEKTGPNSMGWRARGKVWCLWTRLLVTVLTYIYLPCVTGALNLLFCQHSMLSKFELVCYSGIYWVHFFLSLFIYVYIGCLFPIHVYLTIAKYQPKPQKFDETGHRIDQTTDPRQFKLQYRELLKRDTCPYLFLYNGYEHGWSAYRVISMVIKMILVMPMNPFIGQGVGMVSASLCIVSLYAVISCIMRPFILDPDDWVDLTARVTAVLTLVVQICVVSGAVGSDVSGILLTVINAINIIVMVALTLLTMDFTRYYIRRFTGKIHALPHLDYKMDVSRKQRIWQRFWRGLFQSCASLAPCYERLVFMEDMVREYGVEKYRDALLVRNPEIAQARRMAQELEGCDVYYHGALTQPSYWGKMFINPFPFVCTIVYDDTEDYIKIDDDELRDFVHQNYKIPKVVNARKIRQRLRCLNEKDVYYNYTKDMKIGGSLVQVAFTHGILHVETRFPDRFSHGFKVHLDLDDGFANLPSGRTKSNIKLVLHEDDLGITKEFEPTELLLQLIDNPSNKSMILGQWDDYIQRTEFYRSDCDQWRDEEEKELSSAFWYFVFNNDTLPREELQDYLVNRETNKELHNLLSLYEEEFNGLYERLNYFDSNPQNAFWFTFWDDVSMTNNMIKAIEKNPDLFDSAQKTAICYHPSSIESLKKLLFDRDLRKSNGKKGLFNDKVLGLFSQKLYALSGVEPEKLTPYIEPKKYPENFDSRCESIQVSAENAGYLQIATQMEFWK